MDEELREGTTPRPWRVFAAQNTTEVQSRRRRPVVSWPGFDDSAVPRREHDANARLIVAAVNAYDRLRRIEAAARPIARLSDDDVRDYEQGLCFFCGAGHEVVPGPRGGVTGNRHLRPIHEPTCSWAALRTALGED